jgi:site-specific recombinase XerD
MQTSERPVSTTVDDLQTLLPDWRIHLKARNLSPGTVNTYLRDGEQLADFLVRSGMPTAVGDIHREHIEMYLVDLSERTARRVDPATGEPARVSPAYVNKQFRSLQQLFKWLHEDGEITADPMANMKRPQVPETPVPVIPDAHIDALFATCKGNTFENRRDTAVFSVLIDCGVRADELAGILVDEVNFDEHTIGVIGKGRRPRKVPFDAKSADALRRYLRVRRAHKQTASPRLWLGAKGPMTANGIQQMIDRRCQDAGIPHINLHRFRHTFSHRWLAAGGSEQGLMMLAGWKSREMLGRYGKSAAVERAIAEHQRLRNDQVK